MSETVCVETADGAGEVLLDPADAPVAALLLGHGAGGDVDGWDLALLASRLPGRGISVARFRQPYRVLGRRIFSSTRGLDRGWTAALAAVREAWPGVPLFTGGHSAGARTACRGVDADQRGLVLLSFPLHAPGKPNSTRIGELLDAGAPALVIQGGADAFGSGADVREAVGTRARVRVVDVPDAPHALRPGARTTAEQAAGREQLVVGSVLAFIEEQLQQPPAPAGTL